MKMTASVKDLFPKLDTGVRYLRKAAQVGLKLGTSEGAFLVAEAAREECPVDTGALREAIHLEQTVNEPDRQVVLVLPAYPDDNKYGFRPPYARRVHEGFVGPDSLGRIYHQAPNRYMTRARDQAGPDAVAAIRRSIIDELEYANSQVAAKARARK
jgi:hypothetical protein